MTTNETILGQFSVELAPETVSLKNEVERRFGKSIRFTLCTGIPEHAAAFLSEDRSPNIQFRSEADIHETNVVHELNHLKLITDGFPSYELVLDPVAQQYAKTFYRLFQRIRAALQHAIFFPLIRGQGLDPTTDLRLEVDKKRLSPRGGRPRDISDFEYAVDLFAAIMSGDESAADVFRRVLLEQGWSFSVQKAEVLQDITRSARFHEPKGEAEAVVSALNVLFDGQFEFSQDFQRRDSSNNSDYQSNVATVSVAYRVNSARPL